MEHHDDGGYGADGAGDAMVTKAYVVGVLTGFLDNLTRYGLSLSVATNLFILH